MASMARGQCLNMYQTINCFESHHVVRVVQLWFFSGLVTDAAAFSSQRLSEPTGCPFVSTAWVDLCFPAIKTLKRIKHPAISKTYHHVHMRRNNRGRWSSSWTWMDMVVSTFIFFMIISSIVYWSRMLFQWRDGQINWTCSISGYLKYLQVGSIPRSCIIYH